MKNEHTLTPETAFQEDQGTASRIIPSSQQVGARSPQAVPYPLFIYLDSAPVTVVGAGVVAERKIQTLLEYGAKITVVSPEATETVERLAQEGRIRYERRNYERGDVEDALLVFCATDDGEVNERVYADAHELNILVNVVDVPHLCDCIVPSILRRGKLQVAVSTTGAAPSVAKEVRKTLESKYPTWWAEYVDLLGDVRNLIKARVQGTAAQRQPLYEAVAQCDARERIANGETLDAEDVYRQVVEPLLKEAGR